MAGVRILTVGVLVSAVLAQTARGAPIVQSPSADAFINLGAGSYPEESAITTGNAQPWYDSSQIVPLFGGQPTAQQQADFDNAVLQRVEQTFRLSGIALTLTDDPNVSAAHTLSVVSNTDSRSLSSAIGMTEIGGSGFSFIDNMAPAVQSIDQLEWMVAHNVSHELMLAFGVGENYDHSGTFIDSPMVPVSTMLNPYTTFSAAAAAALLATGLGSTQSQVAPGPFGGVVFGVESSSSQSLPQVSPAPIPEPSTLAVWALAATVVTLPRRRTRS